ncbi:hypothetical protein V8G54_034346 [Vigna mungo]|uniref:Uncharacterized protein n=1 Tax=Vigna mungo TaxID=3915 RepID=A0AAQ3MQN3_VIGMU
MDELKPEAGNEVEMVVVVVEGGVGIDQVLNVLKLGELTRDSYGSLVCKAVLFLRLLQKLNKKWMLQVIHRHRYFLLLFAFTTHLNFHAPFSYLFSHHFLTTLVRFFQAYAQHFSDIYVKFCRGIR